MIGSPTAHREAELRVQRRIWEEGAWHTAETGRNRNVKHTLSCTQCPTHTEPHITHTHNHTDTHKHIQTCKQT